LDVGGCARARRQIPGPAQAQALAKLFAHEAARVGPAAAAARVASAAVAVASVARDAATGALADAGGSSARFTNGRAPAPTQPPKPLAPRLLRELFERLGPVRLV
jgi:hypothetical protein